MVVFNWLSESHYNLLYEVRERRLVCSINRPRRRPRRRRAAAAAQYNAGRSQPGTRGAPTGGGGGGGRAFRTQIPHTFVLFKHIRQSLTSPGYIVFHVFDR